jgi:hypothetical protein
MCKSPGANMGGCDAGTRWVEISDTGGRSLGSNIPHDDHLEGQAYVLI